MQPCKLWNDDSVFIEIGVRDTELAHCLRHEGYQKYLGVSSDAQRIASLQSQSPELASQLTHSNRRKLVLNNNAQVLILSGSKRLHMWKFRSVRHAEWVLWDFGFSGFTLLALLGCFWHLLTKRYGRPQVVAFQDPGGKTKRMFASRVLRRKKCSNKALHFIPHRLGLAGFFRDLESQDVRYVVLRWFDSLPEIKPSEDVDMLIADESLEKALSILNGSPGILPCDVYSETGLAESDYCGTPYYPENVASQLLVGAQQHDGLCWVPNRYDYFHSLAYHAVYHKGPRSNLSPGETGVSSRRKSGHDFTTILGDMADQLGIEVDISLEGLHEYLQATGWGPSPEMLARLAVACWRNEWLQLLAQRLDRQVTDQGLAVFILREEAVRRGFQDQIVQMIGESEFEIVAIKTLSSEETHFAAARTRGGNWTQGGPFNSSGGPPSVAVVVYDHQPLPLTQKQKKGFPERTNARLFMKETIRDKIISQLSGGESFNALHSSDHAAEAWHLIEVLAPDLMDEVRAYLHRIYGIDEAVPHYQQAA